MDDNFQLDCQYEPECLQDFWPTGHHEVFAREKEFSVDVNCTCYDRTRL